MPRKKASPKTQDPDQPKSKKPSPNKKPAPKPKKTSQKKTTIATPADINGLTPEGTSIETAPQGTNNELSPQGISKDPTPNHISQATPQNTSNHATPATEPLRSPTFGRRSRVKSGPKPRLRFKARDYTAPWRIQFDRRRPTTNPDGSMTLRPYAPLTQYFQTPAQQAAMRARRREAQDLDANQGHDNQDPDANQEPDPNQVQDQDVTMSAPGDAAPNNDETPTESTLTTTTSDNGKWMRVQPAIPRPVPYFKREITVPGHNPDDDQTFTVDLPAMEDPYLQEAFPYPYPYPFEDEPAQFMPIEWYMPQGPFAAEDFFSMQKLQYSSSIMKTMKFRNEGLPLEQYYARGFDLASTVVLDRERSRRIKEHKAARPSNPLMQPIETILASIQAAEEASALAAETTPAPTPLSALTSTAASTSASTPGMAPPGGSSALPGASTDEQSTDSEQPSATPEQPNTTTDGAGTISDQEIMVTSQSGDAAEQPSSTTQEGTEVTLLDYYQVNKFIATIFETNAGIRHTPPAPLSKGACRILQTLLGDIETKIVAMGCHRQRKELTRLLAERDAVNVQVAAKATEAAKIAAEAAAAATVAEDVPSTPVAKPRKGGRKRENLVDDMGSEQNVEPGYRYKRLHVDDMDEYMEKWVQSRDRHNRALESSVDSQTPTTATTTFKKRKLEQSETADENDQDTLENGPEAELLEMATPREWSPSVNDSDEEEPQSGHGSRKAPRPFIDDPMRIGTSMDPFLKARDFLASRFFQEQVRNAASEGSTEVSQSGPSSTP